MEKDAPNSTKTLHSEITNTLTFKDNILNLFLVKTVIDVETVVDENYQIVNLKLKSEDLYIHQVIYKYFYNKWQRFKNRNNKNETCAIMDTPIKDLPERRFSDDIHPIARYVDEVAETGVFEMPPPISNKEIEQYKNKERIRLLKTESIGILNQIRTSVYPTYIERLNVITEELQALEKIVKNTDTFKFKHKTPTQTFDSFLDCVRYIINDVETTEYTTDLRLYSFTVEQQYYDEIKTNVRSIAKDNDMFCQMQMFPTYNYNGRIYIQIFSNERPI